MNTLRAAVVVTGDDEFINKQRHIYEYCNYSESETIDGEVLFVKYHENEILYDVQILEGSLSKLKNKMKQFLSQGYEVCIPLTFDEFTFKVFNTELFTVGLRKPLKY